MTDAEEIVRDVLACTTSLIPNPDVAGYLFASGVVVSDHIFNAVRSVRKLFGG